MNDVINNRVQGYVNCPFNPAGRDQQISPPLKLVDKPIFNEQVTFPFAKMPEGDKLLVEFNQKLQELLQNGQLKTLVEKYFDSDKGAGRQ